MSVDTASTLETNSPDIRAAILAHVLHHVVSVPASVTYGAVFDSVMKTFGKPEEECSLEVMTAAMMLARAGLIVSNTFQAGCLTIGAETLLTASPQITGWVWKEPDADGENEE